MSYHNFLCEIDFNRSDMQDGYYAIPSSFCNFDPVTGEPQFEIDADENEIVPEGFVYIDESDEDDAYRVLALMFHEDDFDACVTVHRHGRLEIGSREWLVLTDSEADDAYEADLDNYIDDCLEIPDSVRPYFDEEKWKRDARMNGDRGTSLACYDGNEDSVSTNNGTYYIFRVN